MCKIGQIGKVFTIYFDDTRVQSKEQIMNDKDVVLRISPISVLFAVTAVSAARMAMSEMIGALLNGRNSPRVGQEALKTGNKVMNS